MNKQPANNYNYLLGKILPDISLQSTKETKVNLSRLNGSTVIYCYPRTGRPDIEPPKSLSQVPGTKGCTLQSCAFRDHYKEFIELKITVFGISTQSTSYQQEAVNRLALPFELLSDDSLIFAKSLTLPVLYLENLALLERLTLIIKNGVIEKVFYPILVPENNANNVLSWVKNNYERT